jgi:hypothetical protein
MKITIRQYNEENDWFSNECFEVLRIEWDDGSIDEYPDGGAPEDRYFCRDWSWVETVIEKAYEQGVLHGLQTKENK